MLSPPEGGFLQTPSGLHAFSVFSLQVLTDILSTSLTFSALFTCEPLDCRYLAFLHGIVDSDTLPLSVSRETLQQSAALKTIRKKLVRKVLDVVKKLSDADRAVRNPEDGEGELQPV